MVMYRPDVLLKMSSNIDAKKYDYQTICYIDWDKGNLHFHYEILNAENVYTF